MTPIAYRTLSGNVNLANNNYYVVIIVMLAKLETCTSYRAFVVSWQQGLMDRQFLTVYLATGFVKGELLETEVTAADDHETAASSCASG